MKEIRYRLDLSLQEFQWIILCLSTCYNLYKSSDENKHQYLASEMKGLYDKIIHINDMEQVNDQ